ncbi:MAG: pilus assembly protein [Parasporobacterium sp.]|nr:pilus assembly protein [Parasporobacterium sp.]
MKREGVPGMVRNWKRQRFSGSFTIEAAVVIPMTMLLLVTMIFTAFYVHNAATIAAVSDAALLENALYLDENRSSFCSNLEGILGQRLIGETQVSASISGGEDKRSAEVSAVFRIPIAMIDDLTQERLGSLSFRSDVSHLDGRKKLLLYKAICDGAENLLGAGRREKG